ncbi:MAG: Fic family protein [Helicobacteraceae bacterium]|jgi:cell filamentation protein|nr:Fic family protein [Helicobacteraceae bacterium]
MSSATAAIEKSISEKLFYPNTEILRNKPNIQNQAELNRVEAESLAHNEPNRPILTKFTLSEIKLLHRYLFEDIYEWAGELRQYTTGRGAASFARPEYIESYFESSVFQPLAAEKYLKSANKETFVERSAHFANEFNAIHPFIEGNGRITRFFLKDLALQAGYVLSVRRLESTKGAWYEAMILGFERGDTSKLKHIIDYSLENKGIDKQLEKIKDRDKDKDTRFGL